MTQEQLELATPVEEVITEKSFKLSNDDSWREKLELFRNRLGELLANGGEFVIAVAAPKFTFAQFLLHIDESIRQEHNCRCCQEFFEDYAGVVSVGLDGKTRSVFFSEDLAPAGLEEAYRAARDMVEMANVVSPFKISGRKASKGNPNWSHWGINFTPLVRGLHDAALTDDLPTVMRTVSSGFVPETALIGAKTIALLNEYKASTIVARHISMVARYVEAYKAWTSNDSSNKWNALAVRILENKDLYHFRSTAVGSLFQAVATLHESDPAGVKAAVVEYLKATDSVSYKRATEEASQQEVKKANDFLVANGYAESLTLGVAGAAHYNRLDSVWKKPIVTEAPVCTDPATPENPLAILMVDKEAAEAQKIADLPKMESRLGNITRARFMATILPKLKSLKVFAESLALRDFVAVVTQTNSNSKPLYLTADGEPVNHVYFSLTRPDRGGFDPREDWGVVDRMLEVESIHLVQGVSADTPRLLMFTKGVRPKFMGAIKPTFFPDSLTQELQPYRAPLENYINKVGYQHNPEDICGGIQHLQPSGATYYADVGDEILIFSLGDVF